MGIKILLVSLVLELSFLGFSQGENLYQLQKCLRKHYNIKILIFNENMNAREPLEIVLKVLLYHTANWCCYFSKVNECCRCSNVLILGHVDTKGNEDASKAIKVPAVITYSHFCQWLFNICKTCLH